MQRIGPNEIKKQTRGTLFEFYALNMFVDEVM